MASEVKLSRCKKRSIDLKTGYEINLLINLDSNPVQILNFGAFITTF